MVLKEIKVGFLIPLTLDCLPNSGTSTIVIQTKSSGSCLFAVFGMKHYTHVELVIMNVVY